LHEYAQIALPPNFRVLDMPEALQTQDHYLDFRSHYTFDPQTNIVTMTRDGSTHFASDVCTPGDFAQMRPTMEALGRDVRAEVIVKSTLVETSHVASFAPGSPNAPNTPSSPFGP
jgi:hypothetical protein